MWKKVRPYVEAICGVAQWPLMIWYLHVFTNLYR